MLRARHLACLAPVGLALLTPMSAAAATPQIKVRSVTSPPQVVAPGSSFTITGQVASTSRKTTRLRVGVSLRTQKTGRPQLSEDSKRLTLKARRTGRFSVKVTLPSRLAEGVYYVRACVEVGDTTDGCRFTSRRLTIRKAPTPAPSTPTAPATAPTPRAAARIRAAAATRAAAGTPAAGNENPLPQPDPGNTPDFDVLAFTKNAAVSTAAAVDALTEAR